MRKQLGRAMVAMLVAGCGSTAVQGPNDTFIGDWVSTGKVDVTSSSGTFDIPVGSFPISESGEPDTILMAWDPWCTLKATVSGKTATIVPGEVCNCANPADGTAVSLRFDQGTARLEGEELFIEGTGTISGGSSGNLTGTFHWSSTHTRKKD